jgi:altronate hydrolase
LISAVLLGKGDNVAVLVDGGKKGDSFSQREERILLTEDIPPGHKVALEDIEEGSMILKYDHVIGIAKNFIPRGSRVHVHNVKTHLEPGTDLAFDPRPVELEIGESAGTFKGFLRPDGRVGIRNELWVIPAVGCVNTVVQVLASRYEVPGWIDRVQVLSHPYGCSQLGRDLEFTADALAGLARNGNAAGVLIVGLGCENLQPEMMKERLADHPNIRFLQLQDVEDEESAFFRLLDELAADASRERVECPLYSLIIGVKCGGSDAYSSLTANPLVGYVADRVVSWGGTVLATEIPEMFGAEDMLVSRMSDRTVFDDFVNMINWFKDYFISYNQPIYENPSPGNKEGGITTLEEKSIGAVKKAGSGPVTDVLGYGRPSMKKGVNIVFSPGNDLVSTTALAASGAHIILFTTGRGTPFGSVVPTIKISTNSELARKKAGWIDFNAGTILDKGDWDSHILSLSELLKETASGKQTLNEKNGLFEISIFRHGVTL